MKATASALWRELVQHYDTVQTLSRWIVGPGQRHFWFDNWIGKLLQGPLPVDGNLSIAHGLSIISYLWQFIPTRLHDQIAGMVLSPMNRTCLFSRHRLIVSLRSWNILSTLDTGVENDDGRDGFGVLVFCLIFRHFCGKW